MDEFNEKLGFLTEDSNDNINDIINQSMSIEPVEMPKPKSKVGGARPNAGRKSKDYEHNLIDKLNKTIDEDEVMMVLAQLIRKGDFNAIKLYMNYRWGIPKEKIDITTNGKDFNIPVIKFFSNDSDK